MARLLSTQEAAAFLGVSRARVQALADEGRLKKVKIGNQNAYREADLKRLTLLPPGRPRKPAARTD